MAKEKKIYPDIISCPVDRTEFSKFTGQFKFYQTTPPPLSHDEFFNSLSFYQLCVIMDIVYFVMFLLTTGWSDHLSATSCHSLTKYQYLLWINIFNRRRLAKRSAIFITGSVKSMRKWQYAHGVALLFTVIVTWSGFSYTQEGQQTILHCNYQTYCQVNLKDLLDKFEIY